MNQTNLFRRRRLALLFCVILIFAAALPITAFADNAVVTSGSMYSYFQTFGSNGQWKDIQTPSHWITNTGDVAYCLQTSNDTPYYSSYTSVDGAAYYSQYVLTGLRAILENGYPVTNGGFTDEQARYATANAIRFWCAENYCDGMPQYLNLNVNGDWIRGKSGYEDLYYWALSLVLLARNQAVSSPSAGTISFNPSSITLTEDAAGNYFTGQTTVRKTFSNAYGLSHNFPSGSTIDGYTFNDGDTLTISIPTQYENGTYTLTGYGADNVSTAKLFFWAPDAVNQQRVVTCVLDNESIYLEANCTVYTPAKAVRTGSFQITKVDESNHPLSGVSFALYDSGRNLINSGQTDGNGVLTFSNLPLGNYYYAETASLPGYVFDSSLKAFSISEGGQVVRVTATNSRASGGIRITKTDDSGNPLPGVTFTLYDSGQNPITTGQSDSSGVVTFTGLSLGNYYVAETATLPGYILDSSLFPVTISENGQTVTLSATNSRASGSIQITKTDDSGNPLSGVTFALYDSGQNQINRGQTDSNGVVTFSGLPLGDYFYAETASLPGYVFDNSLKAVSITENGQVEAVTATNTLARGSIQISKTDEFGSPLSGVTFSLYDSGQNLINSGQTDSNGVVTFSGLPLGDYFYAETASLPGYVFDNSLKAVAITENGQVVTVTATNSLARGSIQITKVNESGTPLPGVSFALYDSNQNQINGGQTDSNGVITFTELPLGDYFYAETDTLFGYIPDPALYPVSITENGQLVTVSATNRLAHGYISIVKKNSADGSPLAGVHFVLRDSSGSIAAEGDTDSSGALSFGSLLLGSYTLTETAALSGYVMDNAEVPVELTVDGQIVELEFTNTPIKGTLEITKKAMGEDIALSGAGYRLFDASGTQIAEGYTDTWGKLSFTDLPYGSYTYQEFKAPAGFLVDETVYEFSIVNQDEIVSHTRENGRRSGTIEIKKRTADGSPLTGAAYTLEYSDDDGSTWHPVFSRLETDDVSVGSCTSPGLSNGQIYTDNAGNVKFTGLRADRHVIYRVTETAAPEGYSLLSGSLFVGVLPIESENIYAADAEVFDRMALVYTLVITATDDPVFRLPEAGGTGFSYLPLLMMLCTAPIIIFISTKKKGITE